MNEISAAMDRVRSLGGDADVRAGAGIADVRDYAPGGDLPPSNVVQYDMVDGGRVMFRPSGTEPKLKMYYASRGDTKVAADAALDALKNTIDKLGIIV
jgi:phosphomannomutase